MIALLAAAVFVPKMVAVPAGVYWVGEKDHFVNPLRRAKTKGFLISNHEVTNREFALFVEKTGYRTTAERLRNAMVFEPGLAEFRWIQDPTAFWRLPNGTSRGDLSGKETHPVTTISYEDAVAYCKWAEVRLPTLDEWEIASRAGSKSRYFFGDDHRQIGKFANIWHGLDHREADFSDGFQWTSPVGSFAPNPWGLYDIYGNIFELCAGRLPSDRDDNRVHARGGSWWCSWKSCRFFNSVDIGNVHPKASFSNQGFRVVRDLIR